MAEAVDSQPSAVGSAEGEAVPSGRRWPGLVVGFVIVAGFAVTVGRGLEWVINKPYSRLLSIAVSWRYLTISVFVVLMMITIGWVNAAKIRFLFFPKVESDRVSARLAMPSGTAIEETTALTNLIESAALELQAEMKNDDGRPLRRLRPRQRWRAARSMLDDVHAILPGAAACRGRPGDVTARVRTKKSGTPRKRPPLRDYPYVPFGKAIQRRSR